MKQTHQSFAVSFICGAPGSGKSYVMCRDILERLCSFDGTVTTNLPLVVEECAKYVAGKRGCEPESVAERIKIVDADTLRSWQKGASGPWELCGPEMEGSRGNDFILDECHLFCPKTGGTRERKERWTEWLGEIRKELWGRVVFITQDEAKVGEPIKIHSQLRFEITNSESLRDPFLKIPLTYWYELVASITGEYNVSVSVTEFRRIVGKMRPQHMERWRLDPAWFKFYRSYAAPGGGARTGSGEALKREFQKRPRVWFRRDNGRLVAPTWGWFLGHHWWRFAVPTMCIAVFTWLSVFGGSATVVKLWVAGVQGASGRNLQAVKDAAKDKQPGPPQPATVGPSVAAPSGAAGPTQVLPSQNTGTPNRATITRQRAREITTALMSIEEPADRALIMEELRPWLADSIQVQQQEIENLRSEAAARQVNVVAITTDRVWFDDGGVYRKGDMIHEGPLDGKRIEEISLRERRIMLSDGVVLRVGGGVRGLPDATGDGNRAGGAARAGVSDNLRSVVAKRGGRGPGNGESLGRDAASGGDAADRVPAARGGRGGNLGDRRGGVGTAHGDGGRAGAAGG